MKINISKEKRLDVEIPFCSNSTVSSFGLGHLSILEQYNKDIIKITKTKMVVLFLDSAK